MESSIIIVNAHIKPDHGDYVVLKNAGDEAVRAPSHFIFYASRSFGIIGKVVRKKETSEYIPGVNEGTDTG
jgi:hypothetical protein